MIAEYDWQVSLSGHLFDQFLINEALDIIEAAGGSFHLVNCHVGQSFDAISYSELEVSSHLFKTWTFTCGKRYSDIVIDSVRVWFLIVMHIDLEFFEQIDFWFWLPFEQYNSIMLYYD